MSMLALGVGKNSHLPRIAEVTGAASGESAWVGISSTVVYAARASDDSNSVVVLSRSFCFFRSDHNIIREKWSGISILNEIGAGGVKSRYALRMVSFDLGTDLPLIHLPVAS